MNRFIVEPDESKPNDKESDEEYLAVDDDDDIESSKEANTAMKSLISSNKPQLSNFSVLSLLGRKSPVKEKENRSLADSSSHKEIFFPSSENDVAEEGYELDKAEQSQQVGKGNSSLHI